jgi:hypothetical protein
MDASLFMLGYANSYFKYQPWECISDKVRDIKRKVVTDNLNFGGETSIEIDRVGTLLEDIKIDTEVTALTPTGSGTYYRFCDYAGLAIFPTITLSYASNTLHKYDAESMFFKHLRDSNVKDYELYDAQLAGELSAAQRNTRASATQTFRTYLKPWWWKNAGHCVVLTALGNKLKITLDIANLQDIVQTDYTSASATINKVTWIYDIINVSGTERDSFQRYPMSEEGVTYLFEDTHSIKNYKLTAGTDEYIIPLNGLSLPFSSAYAILQPYVDVSTPYAKKKFEPPLATILTVSEAILREGEVADFDKSFGLKDVVDKYNKKHMASLYRKCILFWGMSEVCDLKNANLGSFNSSNLNDLQVKLKFSSTVTADLAFSITFFEHNWINHQGGELQKIFSV